MIYLLGENSRLGKSILDAKSIEIVPLVDEQFRDAIENRSLTFFLSHITNTDLLICCFGKTNPSDPISDLNFSNNLLPRMIYENTHQNQPKIITFGTVLERLIPASNPYVLSKILFNEFVKSEVQVKRILNLQLHTIYGFEKPHLHMFLGQIISAIKTNQPFVMLKGTQLREYWHVEDFVATLTGSISNTNLMGNVDLSSGQPITIRELAIAVFAYFGKDYLLNIDETRVEEMDNHELVFPRSTLFDPLIYRDPITGVIQYLEEVLGR